MEDFALQATKTVDRSEATLTQALSRSDTKYENLEPLLATFRSACQDLIFIDFAAAAGKLVEERLWSGHSKVNAKFRPHLAQFREEAGKKRKVERRKAETVYLTFIKSSQSFYRGYIQRLASSFKDIPELLSLARSMSLDTLSADTPQVVDDDLKKRLVTSCYSALVQCGDLSRYRETELKSDSRNWGPAVGYYNKAAVLDPTDGKAYNQLAVIAREDGDYLRAVYHLYQANCVETPFPQAQGNLRLQFKKLRDRSKQRKPVTDNPDAFIGRRDLYEEFLLFHARSWDKNTQDEDESQSRILRLLAEEIREQPEATILRKFSLINIAAQKTAAENVGGDSSKIESFLVLHSFNVKTFCLLLRMLYDELQQLVPSNGTAARQSLVEVPPITRRILPHLRLYSAWLFTSRQLLEANVALASETQQLWQLYATDLSLLIRLFRFKGVEIQYLLKEDEETLAFSAFDPEVRKTRFCNPSGQFKPIYDESSHGLRQSNNEMLFRISGMVTDGLLLQRDDSVPLAFAQMQFIYLVEGGECLQAERPAISALSEASLHAPHHVLADVNQNMRRNGEPALQISNEPNIAVHVEGAMASRLENMVDDLTNPAAPKVASNRSSMAQGASASPMISPVALAFHDPGTLPPQPSPFNARDLVQRMQQSPSIMHSSPGPQNINIASLPSIYNTPFAPRPGETPKSPRPGSAHRVVPPSLGPQHISCSTEFKTNLTLQADEIQMRTSPISSFQPTPMSHSSIPSVMKPWAHVTNPVQSQPSPWRSTSQNAAFVQQTPISTRPPNSSPYGAIGEPRPRSSRTPNSGQPG